MSANTLPEAQQTLIAQLQNQERQYAAATVIIERLAAATSLTDPARQKDLISLQQALADIRSSGAQVDAARQTYEASGVPRTEQLRQALAQQETRLKEFLARVDGLKDSFSGSKAGMQARLDQKVARRSMHQAYRQSMKTG